MYLCGYPNLVVVKRIYRTIMIRAGVKYVNVNTNKNTAYLYLIKFRTMYLYLIHRIWCIWQISLQIHFIPGPFSKHKFMVHKLVTQCINIPKTQNTTMFIRVETLYLRVSSDLMEGIKFSLCSGRSFESSVFKLITLTNSLGTRCKIALRSRHRISLMRS